MKYKVKVYVRPKSWDAYILADDGISAVITVPLNKNNMDEDIYLAGWEAYTDKWKENKDAQVQVYHLD